MKSMTPPAEYAGVKKSSDLSEIIARLDVIGEQANSGRLRLQTCVETLKGELPPPAPSPCNANEAHYDKPGRIGDITERLDELDRQIAEITYLTERLESIVI